MRYKSELSIMIVMLFGLSLAGVASADSVKKTLYVDGAQVGTATATEAISFPYPNLTIGSEGNRWFRYNGFVGQIDEFAVYGKVLTDANVAAHFSAAPGGYRAAVNADQPLLYLQFEDACSSDGYHAANSGSADMNSTYIGSVALTGSGSGYIGKAAILHGATGGTGDCVDVCDTTGTLSLTDISVEFWLKTTQSSDYPRFFQHNGADTEERSYGAMYSPVGTNAIGLIGGGSTGYINRTLNDGNWHHIVVTYDSTIIIPGPYAAEVMADDPCVYIKFDNPLPVDSSENHYWVGFAGRQNLAAIKPVAGAIGGSALYLDNRDFNESGVHQGAIGRAYVWNNYGKAQFRSFPDYLNYWDDGVAPDGLDYDVFAFAPGDITFELWFKSDPCVSPDTYAFLFQQIDGMPWDTIPNGQVVEPTAPGLCIDSSSTPPQLRVLGGSEWWYPGATAPLDGNWHHAVVTYDENEVNPGHDMAVELYLDGVRYSTTIVDDVNYRAKLGPEFYLLMIGSEQNIGYGQNAWAGYIDEFAVYSGVLSAERVATHYAAWQPKDCAEVWARGLGMKGDLNHDCVVDFYDYAIFAAEWRTCNNPGNPNCGHDW